MGDPVSDDKERLERSKNYPATSTILIVLTAVGAIGYLIAKHFEGAF